MIQSNLPLDSQYPYGIAGKRACQQSADVRMGGLSGRKAGDWLAGGWGGERRDARGSSVRGDTFGGLKVNVGDNIIVDNV